jgi:hypothetical protein
MHYADMISGQLGSSLRIFQGSVRGINSHEVWETSGKPWLTEYDTRKSSVGRQTSFQNGLAEIVLWAFPR